MLHWTPETRALIYPLPNRPDFPPPPLMEPKEAWKAMTAKRKGLASYQSASFDPKLKGAKDRFYGSLPARQDVESDATILAALPGSWVGDVDERWCVWLTVAFGARYAVDVVASVIRGGGQLGRHLNVPLRAAIAHLSRSEYVAAVASVSDLFAHSTEVASFLCYVFPEPPADHAKAAALWSGALPEAFAYGSFDVERFGRAPGRIYDPSACYTMMAVAGEAAVPAIVAGLQAALRSPYASPAATLRALTLSDHPMVGQAMIESLSVASAVPAIRAWISAHPEQGLGPLAESTTDPAIALTKELVRTNADAFRSLLPTLSAEA